MDGISALDEIFRILPVFPSDVAKLPYSIPITRKRQGVSFAATHLKFSADMALEKGLVRADHWPLLSSPSVANSCSLVRSPHRSDRPEHLPSDLLTPLTILSFPGKRSLLRPQPFLLPSWWKREQHQVQDGLLNNLHIKFNKAAPKYLGKEVDSHRNTPPAPHPVLARSVREGHSRAGHLTAANPLASQPPSSQSVSMAWTELRPTSPLPPVHRLKS